MWIVKYSMMYLWFAVALVTRTFPATEASGAAETPTPDWPTLKQPITSLLGSKSTNHMLACWYSQIALAVKQEYGLNAMKKAHSHTKKRHGEETRQLTIGSVSRRSSAMLYSLGTYLKWILSTVCIRDCHAASRTALALRHQLQFAL